MGKYCYIFVKVKSSNLSHFTYVLKNLKIFYRWKEISKFVKETKKWKIFNLGLKVPQTMRNVWSTFKLLILFLKNY